jgi:hypothetical protein
LQQQIERHIHQIPIAGCWLWDGSLTRGYGQLTHQGKHMTAHRASFQAFVRPLKSGEWVLHRCDTRSCVNPHHLYAGTAIDNRRDMLERSRWKHPLGQRTHCFAGHEFVEGGYRMAPDGSRVCKECQKLKKRIYRSKK